MDLLLPFLNQLYNSMQFNPASKEITLNPSPVTTKTVEFFRIYLMNPP